MAKQQEGGKRTVLVAVDGSEHSERAFDWYSKNFYKKGDEILVFHSHELPSMPAAPYPYGFDFSEGWKKHVEESDKKARDLLESYYKKCQERNNNDNFDVTAVAFPDGFDFSEGWKKAAEESDKKARDLLESYWEKCVERNLKCRLIKETGHPGEAVCKVAKERSVDHVVMGSRGLGTLNRALVGSVSDYCLHHAHVPVSVVPPPDRFQHGGFVNKQ